MAECSHEQSRYILDGDEPGITGRSFQCQECWITTSVPATWLHFGLERTFWDCWSDVMSYGSQVNKRFTVLGFEVPDQGAEPCGGTFSTVP